MTERPIGRNERSLRWMDRFVAGVVILGILAALGPMVATQLMVGVGSTESDKWKEWAALLGDSMGAVGSVGSAGAMYFAIRALFLQAAELDFQQEEIRQSGNDLKKTAEAQTESVAALKRSAELQEKVERLTFARVLIEQIQIEAESLKESVAAAIREGGNEPAFNFRDEVRVPIAKVVLLYRRRFFIMQRLKLVMFEQEPPNVRDQLVKILSEHSIRTSIESLGPSKQRFFGLSLIESEVNIRLHWADIPDDDLVW